MYQRSMAERPLLTKSVTAAIVSVIGQLIGSALRASSSSALPPTLSPSSSSPAYTSAQASALVVKAGAAAGVGGNAGGVGGVGVEVVGASPGLLRRVAAFAIFGLCVKGPVFHWWYRALDKVAARRRKADESPGGPRDIAFKLAMDRFVLTPPYLVITFAGLGLLQGFGVERSMREAKGLYLGALATNWTVCTLTQLFNFKVVPLEYRPIFGNCVACWWSIYLSLLSDNN
ncbi:unnamed protein product [Laminaria digitata]